MLNAVLKAVVDMVVFIDGSLDTNNKNMGLHDEQHIHVHTLLPRAPRASSNLSSSTASTSMPSLARIASENRMCN